MLKPVYRSGSILSKKRNVRYIVPKIVTPKRYFRTIMCILFLGRHYAAIYTKRCSWQKYQTVTENVSNSEKHACTCATTFIFIFQNLPIFINQKQYVQKCHSIHSLKKLIGQTFYRFEIISLAIKCLVFLYL